MLYKICIYKGCSIHKESFLEGGGTKSFIFKIFSINVKTELLEFIARIILNLQKYILFKMAAYQAECSWLQQICYQIFAGWEVQTIWKLH